MLDQLGRHGGFDLKVHATGDLEIDAHHTVEDVGMRARGDLPGGMGRQARRSPFRIELCPARRSRRRDRARPLWSPVLHYEVEFPGEKILGDPPFDPQLVEEFWRAFVMSSGITLHVVRAGQEHASHHRGELQGVARALRDAVRVEGDTLPSTKGTL